MKQISSVYYYPYKNLYQLMLRENKGSCMNAYKLKRKKPYGFFV